jgi:glycosyltransferase involved in cell wall biosynthesis
MKICNIIQRYPPAVGGSEIWAQEVCRFISNRGYDVKVLTMDVYNEEEYWRDPPPDNHLVSFGKFNYDNGVEVRRYKRSLPINWLYHLVYKKILDEKMGIYFYGPHSLEMYLRMFKEIKNCGLVHTHTIPYPHNFFSLFWSKISKKKIVMTPHFHPGHPHYERTSNYKLMKMCNAVITVSEYEKEYLIKKGIDREKLFTTGNGINVKEYKPCKLETFKKNFFERYNIKEDSKLVLFLARKIETKGVDQLIDSAKRILKKNKNVVFLLVGPNLKWFDDLYRSLSSELKRNILDLNYVSHQEKVNLLHLSDIFVLPSKFEAFGIVFLEAWACNTPVIGSNQGAVPSIIGGEGLVFEFGNVNDLTDKIEILLEDEELAGEMSKKGKEKILKNYTWDKIGRKVEEVYETII